MLRKSIHQFLLIILGFLLCTLPVLVVHRSTPAQTPTATQWFQTVAEADRLYTAGDRAAAEQLYRQVKPPFAIENQAIVTPITDATQLPAEAQVYWQNAQAAIAAEQEEDASDALDALLEEQPGFIPAYLIYGAVLMDEGDEDEAIAILEQGSVLFPESVELTRALVSALEEENEWLEASIAARQFALAYPEHPDAAALAQIADADFDRFRDRLTTRNVGRGILGGVVGILTGDQGQRAVDNVAMLLQGESGLGSQLAASYKQQSIPIQDPQVVEYINGIGQRIATLMGRDDFDYEFNVVQDDSLNAFALPGGKVFVHTGLILAARSEAELAGVMAHEVAHAVLSHGFQKITNANLLSNLGAVNPLGNLVANLLVLDYSRDAERQSDILGTRVLARAGYAADGLHNFFITLRQQERGSPPAYLRTHPATDSRIAYLEELIQRNGYSRYAFEGVTRHADMQSRLRQIQGV